MGGAFAIESGPDSPLWNPARGLTVNGRPLRSLPFSPEAALSASSLFGISTKPKPRLSPENLSLMMAALGPSYSDSVVTPWPMNGIRPQPAE
jgi:hypothetical protein